MTRVDLIVPTHNAGPLLDACLRSLTRSTFLDFRLIIVDDASAVPVSPPANTPWASTKVIRFEKNIGLAAGFNRAIEVGSSEFVVLLNDDTEVNPEWLLELVECADRHPSAGSVASKLLLMSDRRKIHSAGDYFSVRGVPGNRGAWMDDFGQFDREVPVFGACGGAALYRRMALEDVCQRYGYIFDERLFMYCEDVDLSWRLQVVDRPCVFAYRSVVRHHLSATGGGRFSSYYVARNLPLVLTRSIPRGVLHQYRSRVVAHYLGRLMSAIRHIRGAEARATIRGLLWGVILAALAARSRPPRPCDSDTQRLRALLHDGSVTHT